MTLMDLNKKYDELQQQYGAKKLHAIYNGGCDDSPNFFFVFMNPTSKNIAASQDWNGLRLPWIGTKNIWDIFHDIGLLDTRLYEQIKSITWKNGPRH